MFKDKTIVYTSGTFDMFHYNHLRMINYARSLADILIVGVSTDELVASYKAPPIIPFIERLQILEALKTPDIVIGSHGDRQEAEYRRFRSGGRLEWQIRLSEGSRRSGLLFPLRDGRFLYQNQGDYTR